METMLVGVLILAGFTVLMAGLALTKTIEALRAVQSHARSDTNIALTDLSEALHRTQTLLESTTRSLLVTKAMAADPLASRIVAGRAPEVLAGEQPDTDEEPDDAPLAEDWDDGVLVQMLGGAPQPPHTTVESPDAGHTSPETT